MREFRYNPNARDNNIIVRNGRFFKVKCECCEQVTEEITHDLLISKKRIGVICPDCITTGRAAREYEGVFVNKYEEGIVTDPMKIDELTNRTPGFYGFKEPFWLACCEDFCEYIGIAYNDRDIDEIGNFDELLDECLDKFYKGSKEKLDRKWLRNEIGGDFVNVHIFRCLHCKKYHIFLELNV